MDTEPGRVVSTTGPRLVYRQLVPFHPHAKVAFGGSLTSLTGRAEIWNNTIAVVGGAPPGEFLIDPQAYADAIAAPLAAWFSDAGHALSSDAFLEYVKVNNVNPDGTYADPTTHQHIFSPGVAGAIAQTAPAFCTRVWTWETALTRGYAARGRIYPPNNTVSATGSQFNTGFVNNGITSAKALLSILAIVEPSGSATVRPVVVSAHAAELQDIQGVSSDDVWDVQRRRKNRVQGTRIKAVWP